MNALNETVAFFERLASQLGLGSVRRLI